MTKIKCDTLTASVDSQTYKTLKGNTYTFHRNIFTEIKEPEDALFFLKVGGKNPLFSSDSAINKVKKVLKSVIAKLKKNKDVNEEEAPEETGELEPTEEELAAVDGEEVSKDEPVTTEQPEAPEEEDQPINPHGTQGKNIYTFESLKELNSREQTYMIKKVQGEEATIPRYEKQKIELLLQLQKEGADLIEIQKGYQA